MDTQPKSNPHSTNRSAFANEQIEVAPGIEIPDWDMALSEIERVVAEDAKSSPGIYLQGAVVPAGGE